MPWHVRVHSDPPIIELALSGRLTPTELTEAARETLVLARQQSAPRVLGDCSALEGGHSVVDLYALAEWLAADSVGPRLREAVVIPDLSLVSDHVRFWETACRNRGIEVQAFNDRASALQWLCEVSRSPSGL